MRRRLVLVGMIVLFVVTACGGHSPPRNAVSHSSVPNTRIVPRHITVAYVDAVFVKLNHIYGNAVRSAVKAKAVTPAVRRDLRAIYKNPEYERKISLFKISLRTELPELRHPPGDQLTKVRTLISASPSCIFVRATTTFKAVVAHDKAPAPSEYEELSPKVETGAGKMDPTPWEISLDAVFTKPTVLKNQCAS